VTMQDFTVISNQLNESFLILFNLTDTNFVTVV